MVVVKKAGKTIVCEKCGTARLIRRRVVAMRRNLQPEYAYEEDMGCTRCAIRETLGKELRFQ